MTGIPAPAGPPRTRQSGGRVLVAIAGVALVCGIAWSVLTPTVNGELAEGGQVLVGPIEIASAFSGIAVFALIMLIYGIVVSGLVWWMARSLRGLPGLAIAVGGSIVGTAIAGAVGTLFVGVRTSASGAVVGDAVRVVGSLWLEGHTRAGTSSPWLLAICAPATAVLTYLVLSILAKDGDLGVGDGAASEPTLDVVAPGAYPVGAYPGYQPGQSAQYLAGQQFPGAQQSPGAQQFPGAQQNLSAQQNPGALSSPARLSSPAPLSFPATQSPPDAQSDTEAQQQPPAQG